ncbi:aminomethyl-transferring glycine dehydrogenase subunit GcvPA [Magnetovibrio blakemorei]|uniref:Probable glycine dehydrogenase (decarboxylating) subunit 1 n=1 Tax=Magnetovibrio blakemorei TaxID=28181 RepID=A0A1E5Q7K1_9PROT|nr:aminomethyl-transferring glycine dehydrogenase subunit GcvPA [Magnetovibrio blakemorei]OEJ67126.1 glycine dehydrogenase (aminomethyl-transferring) [Magnetovibrio blakemorei]
MRYLPHTEQDRKDMLDAIGAKTVEDLYCDVPQKALLQAPVDLPLAVGEMEVERTFSAMAAKNLSPSIAPSFLGAGAYRHHVPATVDYMVQRGEFLTAYTPYQPEVSQGTLQYLFEFQTQVALLTGMEVANASMYDGATATAEAVLMAARATRRNRAVLAGGLHAHYFDVTKTSAHSLNIELVHPDSDPTRPADPASVIDLIDDNTACVVVQSPDMFGRIIDLRPIAEAAHAKGALVVAVTTEIVSLGLLEAPGNLGADIVTAEGQSLGIALSYGGPYVGLFATTSKLVRQMPGRVTGQTQDVEGQRGWVLTLSTREQHIRREKATSNICTNAGLCALAFTIHASLLGEEGLSRLARLNHANACTLADKLAAIDGVELMNDSFFNEFTVKLSQPAEEVVEALAKRGILGGVPLTRLLPDRNDLKNYMLVAVTETNTDADMTALVQALEEILS